MSPIQKISNNRLWKVSIEVDSTAIIIFKVLKIEVIFQSLSKKNTKKTETNENEKFSISWNTASCSCRNNHRPAETNNQRREKTLCTQKQSVYSGTKSRPIGRVKYWKLDPFLQRGEKYCCDEFELPSDSPKFYKSHKISVSQVRFTIYFLDTYKNFN